jgi:hypothetical protein
MKPAPMTAVFTLRIDVCVKFLSGRDAGVASDTVSFRGDAKTQTKGFGSVAKI